MAHALNLVLHIKQDEATKAKLAAVKEKFATEIQPKIEKALRESRIVHFARVLVIDDRYLMVITEYDGGHEAYTEFFREALPDVFSVLFDLAEGAPSWDQLNQQNAFFEAAKSMNVRSLGNSTDGSMGVGGETEGYLFSAYGTRTVKEILGALEEAR
jgi:hypothetical protein